ncbi:MAG: histidinol-phosphatase HisJ family protein [Bacillota bacterium]
MKLIDWHTHPYSHGEEEVKPCQNLGRLQDFVTAAEIKGLDGIGFTDHEIYLDQFNFENMEKIKREAEIDVFIGIEFDYAPGRDNEIKEILASYPFDYSIGSVHDLGDWSFDYYKYKDRWEELDYDGLVKSYQEYYNLLDQAVNTGLFEIIGHLDLIKVFDYVIKDRVLVLEMVEPVLDSIKNQGARLEINTNGLNKPVNELYPALDILQLACYKELDIVFSSDAHRPGRVGENFELLQMLMEII